MMPLLRIRLLVLVALVLLAVVLAPTGASCGWYQTCYTEEWLRETIEPYLP
jgi:hypothetical protein